MPIIKAISSVLPKKMIDNSFFYKNFDKEHLRSVEKVVGIKKRFWSKKSDTLSLCCDASEILFSDLLKNKIDLRSKVDLLIFVTQTPNKLMPGIAYDAHHNLDLLDSCSCYSINAGCTGFVEGIGLAYDLMTKRGYKNCLLLVGDTLSKFLDLKDQSTSPIFGDAGTATWIKNNGENNNYLVMSGTKPKSARSIELKFPENGHLKFLTMDGLDVFNFTINGVPKFIKSSIVQFEKKYKINLDIDYYFLHQANNMILDKIIKKLGIDKEKMPLNIEEYGNTSGATIPLLMCSNKDLLINKSCSVLFCGFGVGLSWATMIVESIELISAITTIKE